VEAASQGARPGRRGSRERRMEMAAPPAQAAWEVEQRADMQSMSVTQERERESAMGVMHNQKGECVTRQVRQRHSGRES
jgi:hypothetical protein